MDCQKNLFSLDSDVHYLNCAFKAPLLKSAEAKCHEALIRERNPFHIGVQDFFDPSEEIKKEFAHLVNGQPGDIAIIPSTSYGFGNVLANASPKAKGRVIIGSKEFPSGYYALERWASDNQQELIISETNEEILSSITDQTSVVLVSSVHWINGYLFNLETIGSKCAEVGAIFIVDGTQSVGALPIDVKRFQIHALVCAGYKWLFGPYSLGVAYIHERFHSGSPIEESWSNRVNYRTFHALTDYVDDYRPGAARFNVGETSNFILSPILLDGLKQVNAWGPHNIQDYCSQLKGKLVDGLSNQGIILDSEESSNHLFSISLPEGFDIASVQKELMENKIYTSLRGSSIRVSLNAFNDEMDTQKLVQVLSDLSN